MRNSNKPLILLACAAAISAPVAHAQSIYDWRGGNGDWESAGNWEPSATNPIGTFEQGVYDTRADVVTIDGNYSVTRTGNLQFSGTTLQTAITLRNQASLTVNGTLYVLSAAGGAVRNVSIGTGSTLKANVINTGTSNNSGFKSTWDIAGAIDVARFHGRQGSNAANADQASGFILNVNGGSLRVSDSFSWISGGGNAANLQRVGEINISNNGTVNIGTMAADWITEAWANNPGNVVTFADGSGSLKFGYTNWTDISSVQALISNNYIRMGSDVVGSLRIDDAGDGWVITVIPESSTTIAAIGIAALSAVIALRKRRKS